MLIQGSTHIRAAKLADFDQISHLISDAHRAAGETSLHYAPDVVLQRLNKVWVDDGLVLVTELDGAILACGAIAPTSFARHTWMLSLGATRPDMQGKGLGHQLVHARIDHATEARAGVVLVSSRNESRWSRYGFTRAFTNTVTGAHLMALQFDYGRE